MRKIVAGALLAPALLLVLSCCQFDRFRPKANSRIPATAVPPANAVTPGSANSVAAAPGVVKLEPDNTRVEFVGSKGNSSHKGSFKQLNGTFEIPNNDLTAARLSVEIEMESTDTSIFLLTRHLKSPDFFDAKSFPKATFVSTAIRPSRMAEATHEIAGEMNFHGVARPIAFPARITLTPEQVMLEGTFVLRQSEFGIVEGSKKANDDVPVTVSIRAARR